MLHSSTTYSLATLSSFALYRSKTSFPFAIPLSNLYPYLWVIRIPDLDNILAARIIFAVLLTEPKILIFAKKIKKKFVM